VEVFRFIIANIFPLITRSAWASKKSDILKKDKTATSKSFRYKMRIRQYNKQYGKHYKRPGFFPTMLSFFIRVLPKVGPTRALRFKMPTPQAEKYFVESFDTILQNYTTHIKQLNRSNINFSDKDFDTGNPTHPCEYRLADETYDRWLLKLKDDNFKNLSTAIKKDIVQFYKGLSGPANKYSKKCRQVDEALGEVGKKYIE
jgi:hypothetical protein